MREFMDNHFTDHPTITAEIGRFVLRHSNLTNLNKVEAAVESLKGELASTTLEIKSVKKIANHNRTEIDAIAKKVK